MRSTVATLMFGLVAAEARAAEWSVETVEGAADLHAVWAGGDEICAAGDGATMFRRAGGSWRSEKVPLLVDFRDLAGTAANDLWVAGTAGALGRWDGASWRSVTGDSTSSYVAIAIASPTVAAAATGKRVHVWDGTHWDTVAGRPSFSGLRAIAPVGAAGRFVAVGDAGLVVAIDGKKWDRSAAGSSGDLAGVAACGEGEVIAVGAAAVLRDARGKWKTLAAPPVAVGGAVVRCRGARVERLAAIAGDEVLILDVAANRWSRQTVSAGASLTDVAAWGKGLIVVGKKGLVATIDEW